jgi:hypothetical protein
MVPQDIHPQQILRARLGRIDALHRQVGGGQRPDRQIRHHNQRIGADREHAGRSVLSMGNQASGELIGHQLGPGRAGIEQEPVGTAGHGAVNQDLSAVWVIQVRLDDQRHLRHCWTYCRAEPSRAARDSR